MYNPNFLETRFLLFFAFMLFNNQGFSYNKIAPPCQSIAKEVDRIKNKIYLGSPTLAEELDSFHISNKSLKDCGEIETNDAVFLETYLNEASILKTLKEFDLALMTLEEGLQIAQDREQYLVVTEFYRQKGKVLDAYGKIDRSLEIFQEGVRLSQKYGFNDQEITFNEHIAYALLVYYSNDSLNRKKALELFKKNIEIARLNPQDSIFIQNSISSINRLQKDYDAVLADLEKIRNSKLYAPEQIKEEEGSLYLLKGDTLTAISIYENLLLELKSEKKFNLAFFRTMNNLQSIAFAKQDFQTAFDYANENYTIAKKWNNSSFQLQATKDLAELYVLQGDFKNAYKFSQESSALENDTYGRRSESIRRIYEHKILLGKERLKNELLNKDLVYAKNKNIAYVLLSLLSLLLLGSFAFNMSRRKKHYEETELVNQKLATANHQLDKQNTEISSQLKVIEKQAALLGQQIKEKELQLSQKMLFLVHKNELIQKLDAEVSNNKDFNSLKLNLSKLLKKEQNEDSWEGLNFQFKQSNQDFFNALKDKHPDLSNQELRLCTLLKLNLSTKEIAVLTFIKPESVKVARSRLRKKLNLTDRSMTILKYLRTFDND